MKRKIVLGSILKPVNDTRMFEKWAQSLAGSGAYEVTVIGHDAETPTVPGVKAIGLGTFKRLSLQRWLAPLKMLQLTLQVKPELFVVNTHELLIVGLVNRILFGTKIIYDVQENYYRNLLYGRSFPLPFRWPLAFWVRLKEKLSASWISWFTLAEQGYQDEMSFFKKRFTVIENKCLLPPGFQRAPDRNEIRLLFSGTLAASTGVFAALDLAKQLKIRDPRIRLTIIGFCAQAKPLQQLQQAVHHEDWIDLIGGDRLVPHDQILDAISKAHFGLISYPPSPHIDNAMPTKLYEYLACQLPILLQTHLRWSAICQPCEAAIELDFQSPDPDRILTEMNNRSFYARQPRNITWQEEAQKLLAAIDTLWEDTI